MKIRTSFVSNSSSSSFVVVPQKEVVKLAALSDEEFRKREDIVRKEILGELDELGIDASQGDKWIGLFREGEKEFGWQTRAYYDIPSKWNWMVLQASYGFNEDNWSGPSDPTGECRDAVDEYLAGLGLPTVDWDGIESLKNDCFAFIDHQSIDTQGTFAEIDRIGITEWLYNPYCFVQNGNDNG